MRTLWMLFTIFRDPICQVRREWEHASKHDWGRKLGSVKRGCRWAYSVRLAIQMFEQHAGWRSSIYAVLMSWSRSSSLAYKSCRENGIGITLPHSWLDWSQNAHSIGISAKNCLDPVWPWRDPHHAWAGKEYAAECAYHEGYVTGRNPWYHWKTQLAYCSRVGGG